MTSAGQHADLGTRFIARIIDALIIGIPAWLILYGIGLLTGISPASMLMSKVIAPMLIAVAFTGYCVAQETSRGTTFGKRLVGLRVLAPGGQPPDAQTSLKRNLWAAAALVPCLGAVATLVLSISVAVTISQDPNGQGWHDRFAGGTQVVRT
ncbi:RDD family protein [Nocardia terpenica]|uniref:RDD domain-containing protein n=1 Tax=Nocardia terpenica TaxID=455432 RepID=A0A164HEB5_9NOCA|nr:RDD family protein [Nocardia terpenica]KZM68439.1 hypothetical protein AWN90_11240 [Nocardia terpenica]MBF6064999.1 RDD family protein [Nocardia terpenica]MBF6115271.1 RDD family protein [Nocardia terpenica]MBF6122593.1 RDD family protein [Nocardia terpenica]NQE88616.1 RDD family protein [Nocardia terpenica]